MYKMLKMFPLFMTIQWVHTEDDQDGGSVILGCLEIPQVDHWELHLQVGIN